MMTRIGRTLIMPNHYWGGGVEEITCLVITDSNTTGAFDKEDDNISPWKALTKGSGFPRKASNKATGSYGIGKFASFASTYLRTVLYSTAFKSNGGLKHRFQGKTILVSHKDINGKTLHNIGYLGDGFDSLKDQKVPAQVRMKEPGTSLYIPYYRFGRMGQWLGDSTAIVLKNFFHAIIHGNLQVYFKDSAKNEFPARTIDKNTSSKYQRLIAEDNSTFRFLRVSTMKPQASKTFQDVGDILIRVDVNQEARWREIGLVRDAGMLITSNKQKMFPGIKRIPVHWWGFTVIIECRSKGKSLLRSAESPRHDEISTDYIRDTDMRSLAEERFREIGNWVFEEIRKIAEPDTIGESVNADEIAPWLGIGSDDIIPAGGQEPDVDGDPVVTVPQRTFRSPNQYKKPKINVFEDLVEDIDEEDTDDEAEEVERTDKPVEKRTKNRRNVSVVPQRLMRVRFRTGSHPTHSVLVTFDPPEGDPSQIEVYTLGEDGVKYVVGVRGAYYKGKVLPLKDDLISLPDTSQERLSIEIETREPVQDKSFDLRFIK